MRTTGIMETQGFVMPEAVELDLPAANLVVRCASGLIDLLITIVILVLGFRVVGSTALFADVALLQALVILATVTAIVGVPIAQETLLRGRTVGKLALGLRTVRDDAGPIGLRHAVIRALLMFVEVWLSFGVIALLVAAANSKAKRLGDYLAGTYVVRDRFRLKATPSPQADPLLREWARGADLATLPDALTVAVRQILLRTDTMAPAAHAAMSAQLYSSVLENVAPPPPAGAPPLAVMSTVLAERRRRDLLQAARHDQLRADVLAVDPLASSPLTRPTTTPKPPHTPAE
ncbi:MAG: RDD family protein [Ornithinimicrobium sp.]